ncbi:MAG TPA: hypothetical protein VGR26_16875 [Acidimicrobiales bacterium]|nr:hypothetical protein [Acidimicrobiales bacterium]
MGALVMLVSVLGIRAAAVAHAMLFVPLAAAYVVRGSRHLGLTGGAVLMPLRPVAVPVAVQALLTAALGGALVAGGVGLHLAGALAAVAGVAVVTFMLLRTEPSALKEAFAVAGGAIGRRAPSGTAS